MTTVNHLNKKQGKRILFACLLGGILEWYDFAIFGALAPVMAQLFFPSSNRTVSLLMLFSVFAVGFMVRPLGGLIFGHIGDTKGRKTALSQTIIIMTFATVLIGLLPTYSSIGIFAPILLVIFRLIQGVSVSGQYPGVMAYLKEEFEEKKSSYYTSFSVSSAVLGMFFGYITSSIIFHFFKGDDLQKYGWRIPFLISIALGFVGYYFRKNISDTNVFKKIQQEKRLEKQPLISLLKDFKKEVLKVMGLFWAKELSFYLLFVFFPVFIIHNTFFSKGMVMFFNAINMLIAAMLIPFFGMIADTIGAVLLGLIAVISLIILSFPLFAFLLHKNYMVVFFAQLIFVILIALYQSVMPSIASNIFPARVRYSGLSSCINISSALFGGTAPLIATYLVIATKSSYSPCFYLIFSLLVAGGCLLTVKGKRVALPTKKRK